MNETIRKFLKSLNIDFDSFNSLEGANIRKFADINPILSKYSVFKSKISNKKVSIVDIVGYDYNCMNLGTNLLDNLSWFFDEKGNSYHRRSVPMLDIPKEQVMTQLESSFRKEPVCLIEVESGIYNIGNNGLHRFHVIKTHYLNELSKLNSNNKNEIKKLNGKYSFTANISEIDFIKSYSAFLLNILDNNLAIELHYNSNFEFTGKSCLINYLKPDEKVILTDNQLVEMVQNKIYHFNKEASISEKTQFNKYLNNALKYESFQNYYNEYIKQIQHGGFTWN